MFDIKQHSLYKPMEVDSAIFTVFKIYSKNFVSLYLSSFIAVFALQLFIYEFGFYELIQTVNPEEIQNNLGSFMNTIFMFMIGSVVVYGLLNSFIINYLYTRDFDKNITVSSILSESVKKYAVHMIFFFIVTMLILILGMAFGVIFFIVGAFIAAAYLGTTLISGSALVVVEQKNALEAIGRSFSLAHKDFWPTLGSLVLFILIIILISLVLSAIVSIPYALMFIDNWSESGNLFELFNSDMQEIGIWSVVINSLVSALTYPLFSILSLVLYVKLKYVEDQKIHLDIPR